MSGFKKTVRDGDQLRLLVAKMGEGHHPPELATVTPRGRLAPARKLDDIAADFREALDPSERERTERFDATRPALLSASARVVAHIAELAAANARALAAIGAVQDVLFGSERADGERRESAAHLRRCAVELERVAAPMNLQLDTLRTGVQMTDGHRPRLASDGARYTDTPGLYVQVLADARYCAWLTGRRLLDLAAGLERDAGGWDT